MLTDFLSSLTYAKFLNIILCAALKTNQSMHAVCYSTNNDLLTWTTATSITIISAGYNRSRERQFLINISYIISLPCFLEYPHIFACLKGRLIVIILSRLGTRTFFQQEVLLLHRLRRQTHCLHQDRIL